MKITILTYGSRGDVQPFVALALGLRAAGHSVRLAAPHRFAGLLEIHGIPFAPLPGDPEEISAAVNGLRHDFFGAITSAARYVFSIAASVLRAALASCDDADLIVHSFFFTTAANSLARARGIPDVSVQLLPMLMPTRAFPMIALPGIPAGPLAYLTHWLTTHVYRSVMVMGLERLRRRDTESFDLRPTWPFEGIDTARAPLLSAYSPTILPRPADWKSLEPRITGFLFLQAAEAYQPPQRLVGFLAAGDAPVCVTFGSIVNRDAERVEALVRDTLACVGRRAVLLSGWAGKGAAADSDDVLCLDAVPHDWLFPRCSAVIHYGGVGTTAAVLRAGIPASWSRTASTSCSGGGGSPRSGPGMEGVAPAPYACSSTARVFTHSHGRLAGSSTRRPSVSWCHATVPACPTRRTSRTRRFCFRARDFTVALRLSGHPRPKAKTVLPFRVKR